jgi:putative ABC transport system permease protein
VTDPHFGGTEAPADRASPEAHSAKRLASIRVDTRWRKVIRDLWLHKARTILVILAIAVGIVGAGSVLNTYSLVRQATRQGYLASNPPSATITADSISQELVAQVRALPEISDAQATREVLGRALASGEAERTLHSV